MLHIVNNVYNYVYNTIYSYNYNYLKMYTLFVDNIWQLLNKHTAFFKTSINMCDEVIILRCLWFPLLHVGIFTGNPNYITIFSQLHLKHGWYDHI